MLAGIYKIEDKQKRIYIGSSSNVNRRISEHKRRLVKSDHPNKKLQAIYNKHGMEYFTFTIIQNCEKCELLKHEQHYIDLLFDKYPHSLILNMTRDAKSPMLGKTHTPETREKMKNNKPKRFILIDSNDNIVEGNCIKTFALDNDLSYRNIRRVLDGERFTHKGYTNNAWLIKNKDKYKQR